MSRADFKFIPLSTTSDIHKPEVVNGILVCSDGNLVIVDKNGDEKTIPVVAGMRLFIKPNAIKSSTTADILLD